MLILIENEPRAYSWGSTDAMARLMGRETTGEPQAELWMGAHPASPSRIAKAAPMVMTLPDLVASDPERYGVGGRYLPFLLKILAMHAPLSLQVHPTISDAIAGFEAENALGISMDAPERNYRDRNHKPELLVALDEVTALSGFRGLDEARRDMLAFASAAPNAEGREALLHAAAFCAQDNAVEARRALLLWALKAGSPVAAASKTIESILEGAEAGELALDLFRVESLRTLCEKYPGDPGVLISLLLHLVRLAPGEAIYLQAGQMHAYLGGLAVEVMATSDNVLRGGLTGKHIDPAEFCRIVDFNELQNPRCSSVRVAAGLEVWEPPVRDFKLFRVNVSRDAKYMESGAPAYSEAQDNVMIPASYPLTLVVTHGNIRVERVEDGVFEIARLKQGQALYISAGADIEISGHGEAYLATVGVRW